MPILFLRRSQEAEEEYDLRLMSPVNDVSRILAEGKNLIFVASGHFGASVHHFVASVHKVLHFRIFADGKGS